MILKLGYIRYKIFFLDFIKVCGYKFYLSCIRGWRCLKRIPKHIPIALLLIAILTVVIWIISLIWFVDFISALQVFQSTYLSVFFTWFIVAFVNSENERHKNLVKQFYIYLDIGSILENTVSYFANSINANIEGFSINSMDEYDIAYDKINEFEFKLTAEYWEKESEDVLYKTYKNKDVLNILTKQLVEKIIKLKNDDYKIIGSDTDIQSDCDMVELVYLINSDWSNIKDFDICKERMCDLMHSTYLILAELRRIWRWDIKINNKIDCILEGKQL